MNLNEVNLIGRVTRDPEKKALPNGTSVCSFSLATNRNWKDANGQKQEATDFHNIVAFAKTADIIAQYVVKGQLLFIKGRLSTRTWDDKDTQKKMYRTEVIVDRFEFGPKAGGATAQHEDAPADESGIDFPEDDINPEDIPF